jgi:GDP/UDP-N,N'-diacetylbacillosamine 2-epimerase (hydrolysing)
VLGDRVEAFAAASACVLSNRVLGHLHGGERTGGQDEAMRHAITKLAHLHFAATPGSGRRIVRMGENPDHVFVVGAPGLDVILNERPAGKKELRQAVDVDVSQAFLLVVQHSVSTTPEAGGRQFGATLEAVRRLDMPAVVIYPNSDAGNRRIVEQIEKAAQQGEVTAVRNLPRRLYLGLVRSAAAMVGNSSSGLLEAASYKTPTVNIGSRQQGRERGANVIDAPHNAAAIVRAVRRALSETRFRRRLAQTVNPYGDGRASQRIVRVLRTIPLGKELLQKRIRY